MRPRYTMVARAAVIGLATIILLAGAARSGAAAGSPRLTVSLAPGPQYSRLVRFGLMPVRVTPQLAIWLEDDQGKYVDTLYVTRKTATAAWGSSVRRPASLPIWAHRRGVKHADGLYLPTADKPLADALTGATPTGAFTRQWALPSRLEAGTYVVRVEVNSSYDYNDTYRKDLPPADAHYNTDYSGQPSLLYEGRLAIGRGQARVSLKVVGHGHPAGLTGEVFPDLGGLTDALQLLANATAEAE